MLHSWLTGGSEHLESWCEANEGRVWRRRIVTSTWGRFVENVWVYAFVAVVIVVFAVAAAWIEWRVERRDEPRHRKVLRDEHRYRRDR